MNTSIDLNKDWKGFRKVGKGKMIAKDNLQALHLEYDKYLLQRLNDPSPHLTFKKYLASRDLGFLCDFYDAIIRGNHRHLSSAEAILTGTINYQTWISSSSSSSSPLDTTGFCY